VVHRRGVGCTAVVHRRGVGCTAVVHRRGVGCTAVVHRRGTDGRTRENGSLLVPNKNDVTPWASMDASLLKTIVFFSSCGFIKHGGAAVITDEWFEQCGTDGLGDGYELVMEALPEWIRHSVLRYDVRWRGERWIDTATLEAVNYTDPENNMFAREQIQFAINYVIVNAMRKGAVCDQFAFETIAFNVRWSSDGWDIQTVLVRPMDTEQEQANEYERATHDAPWEPFAYIKFHSLR